MKVSSPSMRKFIAAFVGLLLMPVGTSAGITKKAQPGDAFLVSMTAYNAVPDQTDSSPLVTASGAFSNPDVVIARSADLTAELPFGTVVEIDAATSSATCGYSMVRKEIGLRVVADAMNPKWRNKMDVLLPQKMTTVSGKTVNPAIVFGICNDVIVKVVGHIDISDMPQSQTELASVLDSSTDFTVRQVALD